MLSARKAKKRERRNARRRRARQQKKIKNVGTNWDYIKYAKFMKAVLKPPHKVKIIDCQLEHDELKDILVEHLGKPHFVVLRYHPASKEEYQCIVLHKEHALSFKKSAKTDWVEAQKEFVNFILVSHSLIFKAKQTLNLDEAK